MSSRPEPQFMELLDQIVLNYVPDPITPARRAVAALSLSTKVVTIVCTLLPLLYHSPLGLTVGDIMAKNPQLGVIIESKEPTDLAAEYEELTRDYEQRAASCWASAQAQISAPAVRERFVAADSDQYV